jgi:ribonuclease D
VDVLSGRQAETDVALHRISFARAEASWRETPRSPACLDRQRQSAAQLVHAWRQSQAVRQEANGNWFAAFHLDRLCRLGPENAAWRSRLKEAEEHLPGG